MPGLRDRADTNGTFTALPNDPKRIDWLYHGVEYTVTERLRMVCCRKRMMMQVPVLIEPIAGNGCRAREPFGLTADGATRDEACTRWRSSCCGRLTKMQTCYERTHRLGETKRCE